MLQFEKISVHELAYDRITPKMIKFLAKHYFLNNYLTQNNGFVVFLTFFETKKDKKKFFGTEFGEQALCKFLFLFI